MAAAIMGDEEARGDDFEKEAEKKLGGLGILGSKYEDNADLYEKYKDVIDLYEKAAKCYELAKTWEKAAAVHMKLAGIDIKLESKYEDPTDLYEKYGNVVELYEKAANCYELAETWEKAAAVHIKLADINIKLESKYDAANSYADAVYCYKQYSTTDAAQALNEAVNAHAAQALNEAVNLYLESDRLNMAAKYCKELGESFEASHDLKKAMDCFERAAGLFQSEGVSNSVNSCKQRAAQLAAHLEQYPKAVEIFEEVARQSMNNNLFKYTVRGILLNAGICQLCKNDPVAMTNSLERYQEIDPTFSGTREHKLLADLATSMEEEDIGKFTGAIQEYDNMTRQDPWKTTQSGIMQDVWKTTLLLRVKPRKTEHGGFRLV